MQIKEIKVGAGRTINHPVEDYANLRPSVAIAATLEPNDDVAACTKRLQLQAEQLVEDHARNLRDAIVQQARLGKVQEQLSRISDQIKQAEAERDRLGREYQQMNKAHPILAAGEEDDGAIIEMECPECGQVLAAQPAYGFDRMMAIRCPGCHVGHVAHQCVVAEWHCPACDHEFRRSGHSPTCPECGNLVTV